MKSSFLNVSGWLVLLVAWYIISSLEIVNSHILPSPEKCIDALGKVVSDPNPENNLIDNIWFSIKLNFAGYLEAILFALPFGFALGLFKTTRSMFSQQIDSLRFVPITALGGLFIAISGLTLWTKIHFLAFGIWVYLVPVIVQRIDEVNTVHLQMMQTLGASRWQTFRYVQWESVIARLSDDIRILIGISWTYIIVAEMKNDQGGLGHMIQLAERQANIGIAYDAIVIIIIIGVIQDQIFKWLDRIGFKFKYS